MTFLGFEHLKKQNRSLFLVFEKLQFSIFSFFQISQHWNLWFFVIRSRHTPPKLHWRCWPIPPNGGDGSTFLKINFLKIPMVLIFFLNQTMRLSGCLDKKIKVIGLLENFLDDFEKKFGNFWINFSKKNRKKIEKFFFENFLT